MKWIPLTNEEQLELIKEKSKTTPQIIFKHSTRCGTSSLAKGRLEKATPPEGIDFYYLDLIAYRSISNRVAEDFRVHHESPQILLIKNGDCVYEESHISIRMENIIEQTL